MLRHTAVASHRSQHGQRQAAVRVRVCACVFVFQGALLRARGCRYQYVDSKWDCRYQYVDSKWDCRYQYVDSKHELIWQSIEALDREGMQVSLAGPAGVCPRVCAVLLSARDSFRAFLFAFRPADHRVRLVQVVRRVPNTVALIPSRL